VKVGPFFVAHAQAAKLIQPCEHPLPDPAPSAQSAAVFRVALRKKRDNASVTQTLSDRFSIVTTVTQHAARTMARASALSLQEWKASTSARACCGSISQGIPLRWMNTMPVRHALSAKGGLPPLGFAFATGMNGSINSHSPPGKSSMTIGRLRSVRMFRHSA
jgi:hypothetical protein